MAGVAPLAFSHKTVVSSRDAEEKDSGETQEDPSSGDSSSPLPTRVIGNGHRRTLCDWGLSIRRPSAVSSLFTKHDRRAFLPDASAVSL